MFQTFGATRFASDPVPRPGNVLQYLVKQSLPSVPTRLPLSTKMQSLSILTVPTVPSSEQSF